MTKRTSPIYNLQFQRTWLITIIASLVVAIIGSMLLLAANNDDLWAQNSAWRALSRDLGSLLFVSVALALVWELSGKKSFVDELYSKANIAQSIQSSGLDEIIFHVEDINWGN